MRSFGIAIACYTYYRCTKKKGLCSQKTIRLEKLEEQFDRELKKITIDDDYLKLALDYLGERQDTDVKTEETITKSLQDTYNDTQSRLARLNREYTSPQNTKYELYTPEEFKKLKAELVEERDGIKQQMSGSEKRVDNTLELSERTFNFCTYARHHFENGDLQTKKTIASSLGSNLTLKDGKLNIEALHPYLLIERELASQGAIKSPLEPKKRSSTKGKEMAFATSIPNWLPG